MGSHIYTCCSRHSTNATDVCVTWAFARPAASPKLSLAPYILRCHRSQSPGPSAEINGSLYILSKIVSIISETAVFHTDTWSCQPPKSTRPPSHIRAAVVETQTRTKSYAEKKLIRETRCEQKETLNNQPGMAQGVDQGTMISWRAIGQLLVIRAGRYHEICA